MAYHASIIGPCTTTICIPGTIGLICVLVFADDATHRRGNHLEQREKLGVGPTSKGQSNMRTPPPEPTNALQKVEVCVNGTACITFFFLNG